jgi:CHAT domain-containing protein
MDDASAAQYFNNTFYTFSGYPASYFETSNPTPAQSKMLAELVISSRGVAIDAAHVRRHVQNDAADGRFVALAKRLSGLRAARSTIFFRDPVLAQQVTNAQMDSLSHLERQLLSELAELGLAEREVTVAPFVTLDEVCSRIPDGACLVTYYGYLYVYRTKQYKEEFRYAAMVLDRRGIRGHRLLGFHGASDTLTTAYIKLASDHATSANWSTEKTQKLNDLSARLRKGLWDPIADLVYEDEFVLLAPDLGISLLSFSGLVDDHGSYLAEEHAFHYLTAPRELIRLSDDTSTGAGMLALYDPDYDASPTARLSSVAEDPAWIKSSRPADYAVRNIRPSCERLDSLKLTRLYNSRTEIEALLPGWESKNHEPVSRFSGARANEEAIKHLASGHRVLHIATHGFYVDDVCRGVGDGRGGWNEIPSMYTGLLLAGANLNGRDADELGVEDGILTADEVSSLKLSGTDLVVLSACETGRGDLLYSSGAFSLSRAFRMAGARQVVSALWPVSDAASIDAMAKIYGSPDKTVAEALQDFAIERINADRAAGRPTDPFTWALYISYGDWRAR